MLNRLLGIIYILINRGTVTASELSQRFEVSVRTIYRDVDTLSMAGIPIYTKKGKHGGICLTEQFVLDKMLVTKEEQMQILAALGSLGETGAQDETETLRKLGDFFQMEPASWVAIDFSDWSGRRQELFQIIRQAILKHQVLSFDYYGQKAEMSSRTVEPVQLLFKEYTWYLRAYCRQKQDMRLFKVLRMKRTMVLEETFAPKREEYKAVDSGESTGQAQNLCETKTQERSQSCRHKASGEFGQGELVTIILNIDRSEAYRIYDRFEEEEIQILENGNFRVEMKCRVDQWVYGMILSFGPAAEVLKPLWIREKIKEQLSCMLGRYRHAKEKQQSIL